MLVTKPHSMGQRASMPDYSQTIRDYSHGGKAPEADPFANFLTQIEQSNPSPSTNNSSAYIDTHLGISPYTKENIKAGLQGNEETYRQANSNIPQGLESITKIAPADVSAQILRANQHAEQSIKDAQLTKEINDTYRATSEILKKQGIQVHQPNHSNSISLPIQQEEQQPVESNQQPIRGIPLNPNKGMELWDNKPSMGNFMRTAIPLDSSSLNTLSRVDFNRAAKAKALDSQDVKQLNVKAEKDNVEVETKIDTVSSHDNIGDLSAKYESGTNGSATIGYDRMGGTSYGKYQIASNTGSFKSFLSFLKDTAPDIANILQEAGEANTGSKNGVMPETWKSIASNESERFEKLQEDFIKKSHFEPAFDALQDSGLDTESKTLQQVVWSTAVQHGVTGAKSIFNKALDAISNLTEKDFIASVYDIRSKQFASSTPQVQEAVKSRLESEKNTALSQLS